MGRTLKTLGIAAAVLAVLAMLVLIFGHVGGEEICPQKFTMRRFSYYQLPIIGTQISPVVISKSSRGNGPLSTYLQSNKLLGPVRSKLRWDIVQIDETGRSASRGDADILAKYLEQPGAFGTEDWLAWTKNGANREIVALFWPIIAKMAQHELYILMPDVFDAARASQSAREFTETITTNVPAAIQKLARAEATREETQRAQQLEAIIGEFTKIQAVDTSKIDYEENAREAEAATKSTMAEIDPEDIDLETDLDEDDTSEPE